MNNATAAESAPQKTYGDYVIDQLVSERPLMVKQAKAIGFKDPCPTMPINNRLECWAGYRLRYNNWLHKLIHMKTCIKKDEDSHALQLAKLYNYKNNITFKTLN